MLIRQIVILCLSCLLLTACGVPGPLTLPPDPKDSYIYRVQKEFNAMTGMTSVDVPEVDPDAPITVDEAAEKEDAESKDKSDEKAVTAEKEASESKDSSETKDSAEAKESSEDEGFYSKIKKFFGFEDEPKEAPAELPDEAKPDTVITPIELQTDNP